MREGSSSVVIDCPAHAVWAAISDVTRIGEWSPECIAGRWVDGASGPAVGAKFEGDNVAKFAGRTVKRWTTTSEVTECETDRVFEFVAEGQTTWRYEVLPSGSGTKVTESFSYEPSGLSGFVYEVILRRSRSMTAGMDRTLDRLRATLEASC